MTPAIHIVANPSSGRGQGERRARRLDAELGRLGLATRFTVSESADHVEALARDSAASGGIDVLVVAGGDGTLRRASQGLAGSKTALAVLPAGRGNDLVRALRSPADPVALARLIAERRSRPFDLGRCGEAWFVTVATFGFDACVSGIVHRREVPFRGTLSYVMATLRALSTYQPVDARIEGDFGTIEGPFQMISVANTETYGGGMRIAPGASTADGLLDVCVVRPIGSLKLLRLLPRIFSGGHVSEPEVALHRTRAIRIEAPTSTPIFADGEPMAMTPATLEAVASPLHVIAP